MTSLRSRLVLGSALIAVVPLALAIALLSRRVEGLVESEAAARLDAALGSLQAELAASREQVAQKLSILARDVTLKRLYLLNAEPDLGQYLEEKRFLLGLDALAVTDTSGRRVAGADRRVEARPESVAARSLMLEATAAILYQGEPAGNVRGGLALDSTYLQTLRRTRGVELTLIDGDRVVGSTLGAVASVGAPVDTGAVRRVTLAARPYLVRGFPLELGPGRPVRMIGYVPTAAADRTVRALQWTALLLGLVGVALAIVLGAAWSSQVSRPVETLAAFAQRLAQGRWEEPLTLRSVGELQTLVAALERMRGDLLRYREQLVIGERHAAWSQMARQVAHEVKNPLTPIAISISDLKRSFEQQRADFPRILDQAVRTVGEEVQELKRLLDEFSELGRFPAPVFAPCDAAALLEDLAVLYAGEVGAGRVVIERPEAPLAFVGDAGQMRQALVNLIKNGLEATATGGRVTIAATATPRGLELSVTDTGPGLSAEQRAHLFVPGFTTKTSGSGLGLTIVERIVHDHHGTIVAEPGVAGGTRLRIELTSQREEPLCPPC